MRSTDAEVEGAGAGASPARARARAGGPPLRLARPRAIVNARGVRVALMVLMLGVLPRVAAAGPTAVPVTVHVLTDDAGRAATDDEVAAWIATANERFAAADLTLVVTGTVELARDAVIDRVAERHGLAGEAPKDGTVHVFVARGVADKDQAGAWLGGVHWRYAGGKRAWRGRHYVIVSAEGARIDTCAHELGHFFGLGHRAEDDNLMNGQRVGDATQFDAGQVKTIAAHLRAAVRSRELTPLAAAHQP